ncbi:uncharacterized protein LOC132746027 isoform X2 [Ruditapes philippinarum]|uniref:uncharacterized protein LOC132746027 isoform X2 n=1 Tax=Ruditapes philippinarum TaxID=129788 RepID=UPI00295B8C8A|nr:uncharacterized protein LOC132746027 isoform X2 [Ruditapes philippinarum]
MGYSLHWRWLIQLYYFTMCSSLFFSESNYEGKLDPTDPQKCTTQNATFTCTLQSTPISSHSIGFAVKNSSTNTLYVPVAEDRVTMTNQTVSMFTLYNVTTKTWVKCLYWETFGIINDKEMLGDVSTITVYPMPVELEAVNCVVDNYLDSMNCTWNDGTTYRNGFTPYVTFQWRIPSYSLVWNNCSQLDQQYRYCYWPNSSKGDFTMKPIDIQLIQKSPCGENDTSDFTVDTSQIVKPRPVTELTSRTVNSTCIYVQWRTTNSQMQYPKEHRVSVTNKWDKGQIFKFNTTNKTERYVHNRTFCNLHPYTKYQFTVDIQPIGEEAGFFSDPRQTEAMTYSDFPSASPEVVSGGYGWNPNDCNAPYTKRSICVPLKSIAPINENGPMKGLVVTYINEQGKEMRDDLAEDLKYACTSNLMCNTTYDFYIRARNVNGTSTVSSSIRIPASTLGIEQPNFIVEAGNGTNVTVSWPETGDATTFIVFWCRNRNGNCEEKEKINWREFAGNTREAVIQIEKTNSPQDFLYAVSLLTDQGSSGFSWQECVYLKNAPPQREVRNLAVSPGPEDNSLVATWDKLTCQSDQPYIAKYNVRYNEVNNRHFAVVNVSASGEARVVLRDLKRDQAYSVSVRAVTRTGEYGPIGQLKTSTPVNNSLRQWEIVLIVTGVVIAVIVITIIVILLMSCYRKKKRSILEQGNIKIDDDFMKEEYANRTNSIERQNSDDSGYNPMTPPADRFVDQPSYNATSKPDCQPQLRPDGYCIATNGTSQASLPILHIPYTTDILIPQNPIVADVGFVFNERYSNSGETFLKDFGPPSMHNETAIKTRVKKESGDSGMSETFAKEIIETSETDVLCKTGENVDKKNSQIESIIGSSEVPDYVSVDTASNPSSVIQGNMQAFGGQENRAFSTEMHTSSSGSSPEYVKAQAAPDSLTSQLSSNSYNALTIPSDTIPTVQDHFPENNQTFVERCSNSFDNTVPLLTVIPCPAGMDKSVSNNGTSPTDETSFPLTSYTTVTGPSLSAEEDDGKDGTDMPLPHVQLDRLLSRLPKPSVEIDDDAMNDVAKMNIPDHGSTVNDEQHFEDNAKTSKERNVSDYVQTTDLDCVSPNIGREQNLPYVQTTDQKYFVDCVQPSTPDYYGESARETDQECDISVPDTVFRVEPYVTLPSSSTSQISTVTPFNASINSAQENDVSNVNSLRNAGPDSSLPSEGYVSSDFANQAFNPTISADSTVSFDNHITQSIAGTGYVPTCSAALTMPSIDNASPPTVLQSQTSAFVIGQIPECSVDNENNVSHLQNLICPPALTDNSFVYNPDGYVCHPNSSPDANPSSTVSNNILSRNSPIQYSPSRDSSAYVSSTEIPEIFSKKPQENSETGNPSSSGSLHSYNDEKNTNISKNNCKGPNTNGYVDLKFISEGHLNEAFSFNDDSSNSNFGMRNMASEDEVEDVVESQIDDFTSDSGRSTLEDENSGRDQMQQSNFDGYVSSEYAMERL